jgi:putative lipoic acid-binding regulatory protein
VSSKGAFNGIKVICSTMYQQRQTLGETVTAWLEAARARPGFQIVDIQVRQSSDEAFHCTSIIIFYNEDLATKDKKRRG